MRKKAVIFSVYLVTIVQILPFLSAISNLWCLDEQPEVNAPNDIRPNIKWLHRRLLQGWVQWGSSRQYISPWAPLVRRQFVHNAD
jgi:hypothetical protein